MRHRIVFARQSFAGNGPDGGDTPAAVRPLPEGQDRGIQQRIVVERRGTRRAETAERDHGVFEEHLPQARWRLLRRAARDAREHGVSFTLDNARAQGQRMGGKAAGSVMARDQPGHGVRCGDRRMPVAGRGASRCRDPRRVVDASPVGIGGCRLARRLRHLLQRNRLAGDGHGDQHSRRHPPKRCPTMMQCALRSGLAPRIVGFTSDRLRLA